MDSKNDSPIGTEVENRLDDIFGNGESGASEQNTLEVDRRRDTFFGNEKNPGGKEKKTVSNPKPAVTESAENSPLNDLKSVVLSLEWEISDEVMQRLDEEIVKLEKRCKDDKIVVAFLQLLGSLGKYIRKKQADAHPDSISLINSVYENLEKAMLSEGVNEADKKKMLVTEVNKYKKLKEYIASSKPVVSKPKVEEKPAEKVSIPRTTEIPSVSPEAPVSEPEKEESAPPESEYTASDQNIISLLEKINATIKAEFKALREELRLWRESVK